MDPTGLLVVLALVAAVAAWWLARRRRGHAAEGAPPADPPTAGAAPAAPQVLDRGMLLGNDRVLDPAKWDNTPDEEAGAEDDPEDLPKYFDRDYLRRREGQDPSADRGF